MTRSDGVVFPSGKAQGVYLVGLNNRLTKGAKTYLNTFVGRLR
jgi:hypothetical protein